MRLGIFGGTFNPPHLAHLIGAELVREEFQLSRVLFIPAFIPPHKHQPDVPPTVRLEMLRIAIEDNPFFHLVDLEIKRKGVSYTIDTVKEIMNINKGDSFYLIMGTDQAKEFYEWREPNALLRLFRIIIITRHGHEKDEIDEALKKKAKIFELNMDISSTMIRKRVKNGKSIRYLVPEGVREYIIRKGLYRK
ncbi:nicotinate-nucleotide adenylyltransferase [candidate division WOR-3 bacterium]|nr:nicotinate-nucleotide adenylyltransferase [candidate division WOR-3 bacterium]